MARPLRVEVSGAWYHVTSRANRREALFRSDDDRQAFLARVSELEERFAVEVHAFVLMSNHYHLVLRNLKSNLSRAIQWLNLSYGMRFNWTHKTCGHVFQGRFHSVIIEDEAGVVEVTRYAHLNPVRVSALGLGKTDVQRSRKSKRSDLDAELVRDRLRLLSDYPWSSWRVYSGADGDLRWLKTELIATACGGRSKMEQRKALRAFTEEPVREGMVETPWDRLVGGIVLGGAAFALKIEKMGRKDVPQQTAARRLKRARVVHWKQMVAVAERIREKSWRELLGLHGDWTRDAVMSFATKEGGLRLPEVLLEMPELSYNAAAQGIRRIRERSKTDAQVAVFLKELREGLGSTELQMSKV